MREFQEKFEDEFLSKYATKSKNSKGRKNPMEKCPYRTEFQRDRDRVLHCKAFRRLMHKTQVFISPEGDHYRTRLTHTLEVSQIARTIARGVRANEDLVEAISLSHDLGHTPFGHTGESVLDLLSETGFKHNEQSIRVVEKLEKSGKGLNLTFETLDGILNHRGGLVPGTIEGEIVQLSDKIAYINHDIDDSIRSKMLRQEELPTDVLKILGKTSNERINFIIRDVIDNSQDSPNIVITSEVKTNMYKLRKFMFDTVYMSQLQTKEREKIKNVLNGIYDYYMKDSSKLPEQFYKMEKEGETLNRIVCDYIAGMTDRFALNLFKELFLPSSWNIV